MKKIFSMIIAMFMAFAMTLNAQDICNQKNYLGHSRFFDNTSIGLNGGIQTNLNGWKAPQGAVTGLTLNKEFLPTFGLTVEGELGWNNLGNLVAPGGRHIHNGTAVDFLSVMALGRTNLFNLFGGYKVRPFDMESVFGAGWGHTFGNVDNMFLVKAGLNLNYNFGSDKQWTINLQPAVVWRVNHKVEFNDRYGVAQLTAGITYRFKTSNGTHHMAKAVLYDCGEVLGLREALAEKPNEVEITVVDVQEKVVNVTDTVVVYVFPKIQFKVNSDKIQEASTLNLIDMADMMKSTNDKFVITGYASIEGPELFNQELSGKRAEAVKNALVELGVNPDNLTTVAGGPTDKFGEQLQVNRVAVVNE